MSTKTSKDFVLERSTTRLYAPPGGKTSICLGGYDAEPTRTQKINTVNNASTLSFDFNATNTTTAPVNSARGKGNQSTLSFGDYKESPQKAVSRTPVPLINITNVNQAVSDNYNSTQKPQSGRPTDSHNNIFGQGDVRSSVRVRQAPGGASSIIFG